MKQIKFDFFMEQLSKPVEKKPKIYTPERVDNGNYHYYLAKNGYEITMNGEKVVYEDGLEPYSMIFSTINEAYVSFRYWCRMVEKEYQKSLLIGA